MPDLPTIDDLRRAAEVLDGVAVRTPLFRSPALDQRIGRPVFLKPESLQHTGSFKFRGAYHFLSRLGDEVRSRGVVAYSSGNHAQGVAAAASLHGVPATIVMPADAPEAKVRRTRGHGAEVVSYDRDTESREGIAAGIAAETGATLVPPYDHPWTISGQGTAGLEVAADLAAAGVFEVDVVVPCSGGGLAAGVGLALEIEMPGARLHLAEPEGFDDHAISLREGERTGVPRTSGSICDGLLTPIPGEVTWPINRRLAHGAHHVSDGLVRAAMKALFEDARLVVEPSGAIGIAVLMAGLVVGSGPLVVVLSGGNVDVDIWATAVTG